MKKITLLVLTTFLSMLFSSLFTWITHAAEEKTNKDTQVSLTISPDTEINPEDAYENKDGYIFRKDSVIGLKVSEPEDDIKGALGLDENGKYLMVVVAARALTEDQSIDSINAKVNVDTDTFEVIKMDEKQEGNDWNVFAWDAFPNVEESFYDQDNKQIVFKATSDTSLPLGEVTDVFSYLLKVKKDNTKTKDSIVLEGQEGDNQGLVIVSSTWNDIWANLFQGKVGVSIEGLPVTEVKEEPKEEPVVEEPKEEPVVEEPQVKPKEVETWATENLMLLFVFLMTWVFWFFSLRKRS